MWHEFGLRGQRFCAELVETLEVQEAACLATIMLGIKALWRMAVFEPVEMMRGAWAACHGMLAFSGAAHLTVRSPAAARSPPLAGLPAAAAVH